MNFLSTIIQALCERLGPVAFPEGKSEPEVTLSPNGDAIALVCENGLTVWLFESVHEDKNDDRSSVIVKYVWSFEPNGAYSFKESRLDVYPLFDELRTALLADEILDENIVYHDILVRNQNVATKEMREIREQVARYLQNDGTAHLTRLGPDN